MLQTLLNILFPSSPDIQALETMSPEDFRLSVTRPYEDPPHHISSLFNYRDPLVQKALWELKYRGNRSIAKLFGALLYETILDELSDELLFSNFDAPLLIPLPLSRTRHKDRGWNQSDMLARAIILHDKNNILTFSPHILIKTLHTNPQTKLSRAARMKNLKNCFTIKNPALIKGKNIILIDDVTTTGSTILEAINTLKTQGAREVLGFTIAH